MTHHPFRPFFARRVNFGPASADEMPMRFQRLSAGAMAAICLTLTVVYLAVAYWVVFVTRIGPVAVVIDASAGHGVHAGDSLALPLVVMAGLSFVLGVAALDTALHRQPATPWRT